MLSVDTRVYIYGCDRMSDVLNMDIKSAFLIDVVSNAFLYDGLVWWGRLINSYSGASHNPPNTMYLSTDRREVDLCETETGNTLECRDFYLDSSHYTSETYIPGSPDYFKRKCAYWANFPLETDREIYYSVGLGYNDGVNLTKYTRVVFNGTGKTEFVGYIVKYEFYVAEKGTMSDGTSSINGAVSGSYVDAIINALSGGVIGFETLTFRRSGDKVDFDRDLDGRSIGILPCSEQNARNYVVNTFWARVDLADDGLGNTMAWDDTFYMVFGNGNLFTQDLISTVGPIRVDKLCWFVKIVTEIK